MTCAWDAGSSHFQNVGTSNQWGPSYVVGRDPRGTEFDMSSGGLRAED